MIITTTTELKERVGELLGAEWTSDDLLECIGELHIAGFELGDDLSGYELEFLQPTGMKWVKK